MSDTTAPTINSLSIPTSVDLAAGTAALTIVGTAADDLSGVGQVIVHFDRSFAWSDSPESGSFTTGDSLANTGLADAWSDGASSKTWGVSASNASGEYKITQVTVADIQGNTRTYSAFELTALGINTTVNFYSSTANDAPTGSVTISGSAAQGQTLTASNTLADMDGLGAISYQWLADGQAIAGATGNTFTLGQAQVGKTITVLASYTDGFGTAESRTSGATAAVSNVNDAPTGSVLISGSASQGQTLTASHTLADADGLGTLSYQWLADGQAIAGATGNSLTLEQAQVGKTITVLASYTDGFGTTESRSSGATAAVSNVNDAPTGSVLISGAASQGQTLTASHTLADADGLGTLSYQWLADGQAIAGATGNTFTLGQAQVGKVITVQASYTDGFGTTESRTSGATAAVSNVNDAPTGSVTISGSAAQGQTLSAGHSLADADGLGTLSYQWLADGQAIAGATGNSFTLGQAQVGKVITVQASYTDGFGTTESKTSGATALVSNVNDAPTGSVTISGSAAQGQTLSASHSLADADGLGTLSYQWLADGQAIAGATASSLTLGQAQVGKVITVMASYTDGFGTTESKTSGVTAAVSNVNDAPTGSVTISGSAAQGQTLSASHSLADADGLGSLGYQWLADGEAIAGATASSFTLGQAQVGKVITVKASYTDGFGTAESKTSSATAAVANVNDAPTGSVTVSGTATQGQTLSVGHNLADADGLGALGYQWLADGQAIAGATSSSLTLGQAQVGKVITVMASYTDGFGATESKTSSATAAVANVNDSPTGSVTVSGTATQGQTLSAGHSLADADGLGTLSYQWLADGQAITGATASTFSPGQAQVGKAISVRISYTDGFGTAESKTSSATAAVANVNDAPTGSVTVSGTATQGQTLSAGHSLADADGLGTLGYQWLADGQAIAGATASTFNPGQAQVGKTISVRISYTDGFGTAESKTSSATAAVANVNDAPTGSVTVSGTATQGQTLSVSHSLADADGLGTLGYQWLADGQAIAGATASSFTLGQAQVGKVITVRASYTDGFGAAESKTSAATAAVANVNDAPTGSVTVSGTAAQGQTLSAGHSLADVDGLGILNYQWLADGEAIAGATASTFILGQAQVGKAIAVRISYTDGQGTLESQTSAVLSSGGQPAIVVNSNDAPTGSVTISGTAAQGQTLSVSHSLADADGLGTLSYQWLADGEAIAGATASSFTLGQAQVGKAITVRASYTDGFGTAESKTSAASGAVANVNDAPTGSVTVSGTAAQGQTLTASHNLADIDGLGALSYQWLANGEIIAGATASSLTLGQAQVGKVVAVRIGYTDGFGTAESKTSSASGAVANVNDAPTGSVTVSGAAAQGQILTAGHDLADLDGLGAVSYQWLADGEAIAGATGSSLTLGQAQVGKAIAVRASYTDGQGSLESIVSAVLAAGVVVNTNDAPTGSVSVSGEAKEGQTLSVSHSLADADGLGTLSYQWLADGEAIAGATASSFTPGQAQIGKAVSVRVSYTDGFGNQESKTSAATVAVERTYVYLTPGKDTYYGTDASDWVVGLGSTDKLYGGRGDDGYIVNLTGKNKLEDRIVEKAGEGVDTLLLAAGSASRNATTLTLGAHLENLDASQTGSTKLNLRGNALGNRLTGNDADNILDGKVGADTLSGGKGNDTYVIDNAQDRIIEEVGQGRDQVNVAIAAPGGAWTLGANLENATLTSKVAFDLIGNALDNVLKGNKAANRIDGGAGADRMEGGAGNDTYVVDNVGDTIVDSSGVDTVESGLSYILGAGLENLLLSGSAALDGTGNGLANVLTGNDGNNRLDGLAGKDSLFGGKGDDTYVVDLTSQNLLEDNLHERAGEGRDTVILRGGNASLGPVTLTLGAHLENLDASQTASVSLNLHGNGLDNVLTGNAAQNVFTGGDGSDTFRFASLAAMGATSTSWDIVTDFTSGVDKIDLAGLDSNTATAADDAFFAIIDSAAAFTAAGQLKLSGGVLYGNCDGDAEAEFAIQLNGVASLTLADFVL